MPTLERTVVLPVESLDPHDTPERVAARPDSGLSHDRQFATVDADGDYADREDDRRVRQIRSWFDPKAG